jgi:large subunit ribosomal protein L6
MSRIGNAPIPVPEAAEVVLDGPRVTVKGSLGELAHEVPDLLELEYAPKERLLTVSRANDSRRARSLHGLHRTLIANKVQGVTEGFSKVLEVYGTGYSANLRARTLVLQVGFCHEVTFDLPDGIGVDIEQNSAQAERPARFTVKGIDKAMVGQFAASVRAVRPPEPYKGKGIRYAGEYVRRKEGKAFTGLER